VTTPLERGRPTSLRRLCAVLALASLSSGCEPELVVGTWSCPTPSSPTGDGTPPASIEKIVEATWTTGFESGFCDYTRTSGVCYSAPDASYGIVSAPVHSGRAAASFFVNSDPARDGTQARCFREGAFPMSAVYGAWFYVPRFMSNDGNWNLMHFQGGVPGDLHGLWDVSLGSADDGQLSLYMLDFSRRNFVRAPDDAAPAVPIGSWFQIELRWRRAADASGEIALYQDGQLVLQRTSIATDDTNFAQWYVGNFADALTPADSTIYVDDVTIRPLP